MPDGPLTTASPTIESILARRGLLSGAALERVRPLEAESGERIGRIAAKLGMISDADLAAAYAELLGTRVLTAADLPAEAIAPNRLGQTFLKQARVIPLAETETERVAAMADPLDDAAARALAFALDKPIVRKVALPTDIEAAFERLYGSTAQSVSVELAPAQDEDRDTDLERLKDLASEAADAAVSTVLSDGRCNRAASTLLRPHDDSSPLDRG